MATAAFRSTSKRTSIGGGADDSSSSTRNAAASSRRRSRSVSRFSHRLPSESAEFVDERATKNPAAATKGKFVNYARGAAFPEISLDDLAIEMFSSGERGRSSEVSSGAGASQRRGRSVSRQTSSRVAGERSVVGGRSNVEGRSTICGGKDASGRRRRSLSVVRFRASDSESDNSDNHTVQKSFNSFSSRNKQQATVHERQPPVQPRGLRRSSSQRDFLKSNDGYSSDHHVRNGLANDLSKVTRKELRHAANEIKMGLEEVRDDNLSKWVNNGRLQPKSLNVLQGVSTKLEQSEKRKQELLAQIVLEEQHSKELRGIVGELLPVTKETYASRRLARPRKRSNDRRRITKQLDEEAEEIIENFISSVEENTDISSFDGDRSDTSSTFGVPMRPKDVMLHFGELESYTTPRRVTSLPVEADDGVALPWLQWETNIDGSIPVKDKNDTPAASETVLHDAHEETSNVNQEQSNQSLSSRGSWSPAIAEGFSLDSEEVSKTTKPAETLKSQLLAAVPRRSRVNIDEYLEPRSSEELLIERWKCRDRVSSGGILLCEGSSSLIFL